MKLVADTQKRYQSLEWLALGILFGLALVGTSVAYQARAWFVGALFGIIAMGTFGVLGYRIGVHFKRGKRTLNKARKTRWMFNQSLFLVLELIFLLSILSVFYVEGIAFRKDWTRDRLFSLSNRSAEILKTIDQELTILFFDIPTEWNALDELLKAYARASDFVNYEFVDMTQEQARVRTYDVRDEETLVFYQNKNSQRILKAFKEDLNPFGEQARRSQSATGDVSLTQINNYEGIINETILTLSQTAPAQTLYFFQTEENSWKLNTTDGQGLSFLKDNIERLGYHVASISLETLSARASASPLRKRDVVFLSESELLTLSPARLERLMEPASAWMNHLKNGGGMLLSAAAKNTPPEFLKTRTRHLIQWYQLFGLTAPTGIIVDTENFHPVLGQKLYEAQGQVIADFPFIMYAATHPITETLKRVRLTPFLLTPQVVEVPPTLKNRKDNPWQVTPLLKSSPRAWLEQDYITEVAEAGTPRYHFGTDQEGEYPVAWALSNHQTTSRGIFIGDDTFIQNDLIVLFGNRDFILNAILWVGGSDTLLGSDYKARAEPLFLPSQRATLLFLIVFVLGFPVLFTCIGFYRVYKNKTTTA